MFKKPFGNLKTSAPLKNSDRRKLKQRVLQSFPRIPPEDGDQAVPDGLLSVKFSTHLDEPGVAYLAPNGDPLWFTLGKGSEELIPTVYTLWMRPALLPFLSTPASVIPVLVGGADLMIPGVVHHTPSLSLDQVVSITQYYPNKIGPPLAVGRMALGSDGMGEDGKKGKAVYVLHTWKDCLWELGGGGEVPEPRDLEVESEEGDVITGEVESTAETTTEEPIQSTSKLTPQEVTSILRTSFIQSASTTLSKLAPSSFPITSTVLYSTYILPFRPYTLPSSPNPPPTTPIDIKNSSHKSLTAFLKSLEKEGLLKLKDQKMTGKSTELVITSVNEKHGDVASHQNFTTLKDVEDKKAKQEEREEGERNKVKEMTVVELWKPWQGTVGFFEAAGVKLGELLSLSEIKIALNDYIARQNLVNPNDRAYINIDAVLLSALKSKNSTEAIEFMKKDELTRKLVEKMQAWYSISIDGEERVTKKGPFHPVSVVVKIRQGRKASTLITNFEPFGLGADFLAEELRKICASATSVSPVQGKSSRMEVLVQGKQIPAVVELLMSKGVPKKWIEGVDQSDKKKK